MICFDEVSNFKTNRHREFINPIRAFEHLTKLAACASWHNPCTMMFTLDHQALQTKPYAGRK